MEIGLRLNQLKNIVKPQNTKVAEKNTTDPNAPKLNAPLTKDTVSFTANWTKHNGFWNAEYWEDENGNQVFDDPSASSSTNECEDSSSSDDTSAPAESEWEYTPGSWHSCQEWVHKGTGEKVHNQRDVEYYDKKYAKERAEAASKSSSSDDTSTAAESEWEYTPGSWHSCEQWVHKGTRQKVHNQRDVEYYDKKYAKEKESTEATSKSRLTNEEKKEIEHQIQGNNDVKSPRGLIEKVVGKDGKLEPTNTGTNKTYMKVNDDLGVLEMDKTSFKKLQETNEKLRKKGVNELTQPIIDYKETSNGRYQVLTTHKGSSLKDERDNLSVKDTEEVVKQIREINSNAAKNGVVAADAGNPGNYTISHDKNGNIKVSMIDVTPSDTISASENASKISYMADSLIKSAYSNESSGKVQGGSKKIKDINAMLRSNRDESSKSSSSGEVKDGKGNVRVSKSKLQQEQEEYEKELKEWEKKQEEAKLRAEAYEEACRRAKENK